MMSCWWLLVVLLAGGVRAAACPQGCSCHHQQGLYAANCSALPYSGGKLEALTVLPSRDSPLELSDGQFNSARHLKYLNLQNCSIYFVHKKAFYGAKNLVEIDLSFNYIEELDPMVFQHITSLVSLSLRGNLIHFMSEAPFLISNSLQHLDIGQCRIRSVPRGVFYGLKRLNYLSMDANFLKTLKYNSLPKGLKYLNLSRNHIVNVPVEVLSTLTNLRRIGLSGNPVNCSCSLMNLQDWFSGRGVIFEDDVTCAFPPEYYGMSWSKVDENRLCISETRREEMSHATIHSPQFRKRFYKGNYFGNENSFLRDNVQSDQPQLPDLQAEVLFQNDDTLAMGEMMKDENEKGLDDELSGFKQDYVANIEEDSDTVSKITADNSKQEIDESHDINTRISEVDASGNKKEDSILSMLMSDGVNGLNSSGVLADSLNLESIDSISEDNTQDNKVDGEDKYFDNPKHTVESNVNIDSLVTNSPINNMEKITDLEPSQPVDLGENNPVEYKSLNEEDSNTELDDLKKEGLYHVDNDGIKLNTNESTEESTVIPDIEETTEDEVASTQESLILEDGTAKNSTTSTEDYNATVVEDIIKAEYGAEETIPPPVIVPDLITPVEPKQNTSESVIPMNENEAFIDSEVKETEDKSLLSPEMTSDKKEDKIKQVAGADVLMFCIAVLIICLVLYSVYKCRTSNKRDNMRIVKDMESNRGTEMQDMASLLPKPEEGGKPTIMKYTDKAALSETMELIKQPNENEEHKLTPSVDSRNKIEDKNSLNNNTHNSDTNTTPLLKPAHPVTINPTDPIRRTKVRVGIIPDSIPRTPIFLQKTYNDTKQV